MKTKALIPVGIFFVASSLWAAVPQNESHYKDEVKSIFKHSPSKRSLIFKSHGVRGKQTLAEIAFEKTESLEVRWDAIVTLGRIDPKYAQPHLEKALISSDWFMRNAALVVVSYGDRTWAIQKARLALHDPALVVRTAAVKVLHDLRAIEAKKTLWEKMSSSENFKRGESLWIRPIIANALAVMADPAEKKQFEGMLLDRDPGVQSAAKIALAKFSIKN